MHTMSSTTSSPTTSSCLHLLQSLKTQSQEYGGAVRCCHQGLVCVPSTAVERRQDRSSGVARHGARACVMQFDARTNFSLFFGQENRIFLATRSVLWPKICRKCDSGRGSAPDPAGGAHDAPPHPLVGWGADTPPHTHPTQRLLAPRCSRLRRLVRRAPPP